MDELFKRLKEEITFGEALEIQVECVSSEQADKLHLKVLEGQFFKDWQVKRKDEKEKFLLCLRLPPDELADNDDWAAS